MVNRGRDSVAWGNGLWRNRVGRATGTHATRGSSSGEDGGEEGGREEEEGGVWLGRASSSLLGGDFLFLCKGTTSLMGGSLEQASLEAGQGGRGRARGLREAG